VRVSYLLGNIAGIRRSIFLSGWFKWQEALGTVAAIFLFFAGLQCTIRVRVPYGGKKGEFRISDLLGAIQKLGVLDSTQLLGRQFEITLEDERRQPVGYSLLLLKYPDGIETLFADSAGRVVLTLTQELIQRNPELVGTKDGVLLTIAARLFAAFELGANERWLTIEPANYQRRFGNGVVVLYRRTPEVLVDSVLHLLNQQRRWIEANLPVEPIGWGVVLVDSPPPFSLIKTHIRSDTMEFHLFPYWESEWREGLYRDNFQRFTKNCLFRTLPYFSEESAVWLFGGLPGYWSYEYFCSIFETIPPDLGPLMYNNQEWAMLESLLAINPDSTLDLLSWTPSGALDWFLALNCSRAFWKVVHDTYGSKAVAQFLGAAKKTQNLTSERLVELLIVSTGPDIKLLLKSFPKSRALSVLLAMHQEIDRR